MAGPAGGRRRRRGACLMGTAAMLLLARSCCGHIYPATAEEPWRTGRFASRYRSGDGRVKCDSALDTTTTTTTTTHEDAPPFSSSSIDRRGLLGGESCRLSVVGLGWGGVFFAFRLAGLDAPLSRERPLIDPRTICFFEADERVGGRVLSVHDLPLMDDLVIDVGAYRFKEVQLLPRRLVEDVLLLPTTCYDYQEQQQHYCRDLSGEGGMRKLVDPYGNNAGYARAVEVMLEKLEASGARVWFDHRLLAVRQDQQHHIRLEFGGGGVEEEVVISEQVMLNLPPSALASLEGKGVLVEAEALQPALLVPALHSPSGQGLTKAYLHYEDAWWASVLGLMQGNFSHNTSQPELQGRYHDGPIKCQIGVDDLGQPVFSARPLPFTRPCSGALLAYYGLTTDYYSALQADPRRPLTVLLAANDSSQSSVVLRELHEQLVSLHWEALQAMGVEDPSSLPGPDALFLGSWRVEDDLQPTILHYPETLPPDTAMKLESAVRRPVPGLDLFIANQGFGAAWQGWAESVLLMVERTLAQPPFSLPRPQWLDRDYYLQHVTSQLPQQQP